MAAGASFLELLELALKGEWDKATLLQSEFVKHSSWIM
ncbi:hypothetical protein ACZ87_01314 [Candidatus Erwinia dacicola]|uniref:Uncharacterized protein n=1 Tax=Candidatus Erwinia dacicola TaxID=252393 RepID=A0A328TN87_9GAMM|nr:hypothetical protein ACZ87_01314 [Candidatus Erwinia dacicola]